MLLMEVFLIPICFYAAINDFLFYKIPNWLVLLIIGVYLLKSCFIILMGASINILIEPSIGFAAVLALGFVLFSLRVLGAGDAKLMAACSLWMSEINTLQFIVLVTLSGGLLALIYLFYKNPLAFIRELMLSKIVVKFGLTAGIKEDKNMVPYAVAIFAGVVWVALING
jgi:Flp pilus assembly protein protease CpaA